MPYDSWEHLSEHAKHICREIVAPKGHVVLGAGFVSAIAEEREAFIATQKDKLRISPGKL